MQNHSEKPLIILGVDPGTRVSGYGVIHIDNQDYKPLDYGCIRPPPNFKLSDRYLVLFDSIVALIDEHQPTALVVETQYVHKNVQSAIKLGMARGTIILAAKKRGISVFEFSPAVAKRAVTGNGRASKFQVQAMVQRLLNLTTPPEPEDAADALALAICYAHAAPHTRGAKEV